MTSAPLASASLPQDAVARSATRKIVIRMVPFLMVCYFLALLDRVNIGFAALQMNADLGLTPAMFGFAASLYFVAYFALEVPSNLALQKFGAQIWIGRIMITWGLLAACMAFVQGPYSLYGMRLALGAAEAGFFPGALLYLSYWLPPEIKGRVLAIFTAANAAAGFLGSPISALLFELDGVFGLRGWQWMFLIEGLPTVLIGIAAFFVLTDKPHEARWLTSAERQWLVARMDAEDAKKRPVGHIPLWQLLTNKYFLTMAVLACGTSSTAAVLAAWQPQILKSMGLTNFQTGFVNAIPYAVTAVVMVWWARHSDKTGERRWHALMPLTIAGLSFIGLGLFSGALIPTVFLLTCCLCGGYSFKGPFWAMANQWLSPSTMAAGLAGINAFANLLGGGFMINVVGITKQYTGSYTLGMMPIVGLTLGGALAGYLVGRGAAKAASTPAEFSQAPEQSRT